MTGPRPRRRSAIGLGSVVLLVGLLLSSSRVAAQSPPVYAADSILVRFRGAAVAHERAPGAGARFRAWGGACSGTATTCVVTLDDLRAVTATFSRVFTDANAQDLLPAGTPIKAVHFTELLDAINAAQPGTNLSWIGPAPAVGEAVRAVHATTLRQAVGLGGVAPGSPIAAGHINEIRLRIRALE